MKFLVLALCVCAASAAYDYKPYQPFSAAQQPARRVAQTVASAPKAVASAAYAAPKVAYEAAKAVVTAPVVAAKAVYAAGKDAEASILRYDNDVEPDQFQYAYETSNSISAEASGHLVNDNLVIQGGYRYSAPDGTPVQFTYIADENGYQPQSNLLPVGPPIPEAILRALEYLRLHAPTNPEKY